jgi:hypothetical protein
LWGRPAVGSEKDNVNISIEKPSVDLSQTTTLEGIIFVIYIPPHSDGTGGIYLSTKDVPLFFTVRINITFKDNAILGLSRC